MNFKIKTNKLRITLDREQLVQKYDIYQIKTSDKYFKMGARVLDAADLDKRILSILFQEGSRFLLMTKKDALSTKKLRDVLYKTEDGDKITIDKAPIAEIPDAKILQLLMNAMGNFKSEFLRYSNLTGHFYSFHPAWLAHGKKEEKAIIWQVVCLEVLISEDFCLQLPVRTFTSTKLKSKIEFKKRKFEEYPQYVLTAKNTLRRRLDSDVNTDAYIQRQIDGERSTEEFLNIQNLELFEQSKMGMAQMVIKNFNSLYEGIAGLAFEEIEDYKAFDYSSRCARENKARIQDYLSLQPTRIVDAIQDEYSLELCEEIQNLLMEKYGVRAKIGSRLSKNAFNIRLIHELEYYRGIEDPHKAFADQAVQHVTFENFRRSAKVAIDTVIHELLIKHDLVADKIQIFDWEKTGLTENIAFGLPATIDNVEKYVFMEIEPDGSFHIEEEEFDLFHLQSYQDCITIFEDAKAQHENVLGLIRMSNGNINVIKDTGWIGIPEIDRLYDELSSGNTKLRGKAVRDELLGASLDVKCFTEGNAGYYFSGIIGGGMRSDVGCAANIRKIEPYKDAPLMLEELMPLMTVTFVRNKQLTVVPFPFKYLREYIKAAR